jgi:predicted ATP-dependent endonuclease of OLD family
MELVYLWVEDYKNIHQQGFNFSGRYRCDYDGENLTIEENNEYIHIFPENINVTAIVGENGSGKSSIIELIKQIFLYTPNIELGFVHTTRSYPFNFILVFSRDERREYISNFEVHNSTIEQARIIGHLDYYLYLAEDQIPLNEYGEKNDHQISLAKNEIANMICSSYIADIDFELTSFMYIPKEVQIETVSLHTMYSDLVEHEKQPSLFDFDSSDSDLTEREEDRRDRDIRNEMYAREDNLNSLFEEAQDNFHRFLIIWYLRAIGYDDNDYQLCDKEYLLSEFRDVDEYINEEDFTQFFQNRNVRIQELSSREKDVYFKYYKDYFNFDFIDSRERRFNDLSHGEQTIFGQLLSIYYYSLKSDNNMMLLFNEPDLSLHPQWQKMYIYEVLDLLKKIPHKRFSFIFTTHSPFLLSDLPKENVIFLERYTKEEHEVQNGLQKVGNCKNVTKHTNIDTFGANIHTLLSHGFFMKDGLMGEFAKSKINEVIALLKSKRKLSKKNQKFCEDIISIIGEPILRKTLQHQLYQRLNTNSNETELQKLEREQKEIQAKIDKLKSDHHETN